MVLYYYLILKLVLNHKVKLFGDKQMNIKYLELFSLIRWIRWVQISL